jgi:threonine dehydratase
MTSFAVVFLQVKCVVETRDADHVKELDRLLRSHYTHVQFGPHII